MPADKDGKTEKPTPKRLREARKKGQVPKSQDLSSAISFGVFSLALVFLGNYVIQWGFVLLRNSLTGGLEVDNLGNELNNIGLTALIWFVIMAAPFLGIALLTGVIGNMVQVGFLFTSEPLKPSLKTLNPISGFKNLFGKKAMFGLAKNLIKLAIVISFTIYILWQSLQMIMNSGRIGTVNVFPFMIDLVSSLAFQLAIFLAVLGIADYFYQRYSHKQELMMTIKEMKDEYKEMEGDPQVKSQRKARYKQMMAGKLSDVDSATVLITNPTHYAIAVRYEKGLDEVPIVLAKGQDLMAQRMKQRAEQNNVPMFENKPLAQSLFKEVEPGQPVPSEMYQSIAEILALVFQAEQRNKKKI